jgi:hypothetical protein
MVNLRKKVAHNQVEGINQGFFSLDFGKMKIFQQETLFFLSPSDNGKIIINIPRVKPRSFARIKKRPKSFFFGIEPLTYFIKVLKTMF